LIHNLWPFFLYADFVTDFLYWSTRGFWQSGVDVFKDGVDVFVGGMTISVELWSKFIGS